MKINTVCNTTLDVSLWRFRYLRGLAGKLTTDPKQMKELAEAYEEIDKVAKRSVELTEEVARLEQTAGGSSVDVPALIEAVTTLLLNFIANDLVLYLIYQPWRDPSGGGQESSQVRSGLR